MDIFGVKNDVMKELHREKEFLWEGVRDLQSKLESQAKENIALADEYQKLQSKINSLRKSAPEHYKELENTSRAVTTLKTRIKTRTNELKSYLEEAKKDISSIRSISESADELQSQVKDYSTTLADLNNAILAHNDSVTQRIESADSHINELDELLSRKESLEADIQSISESNDESQQLLGTLKNLRASAVKDRNEIRTAYDEIFGYDTDDLDEDDEPIRVKGKVETLDESYKKIEGELKRYYETNTKLADELAQNVERIEQDCTSKFEGYIDSCREQHDDALERINKLLPAALTAGLATAYDKKVHAESAELERHDRSFKNAIFMLITVSLLPIFITYFYQGSGSAAIEFAEIVDRIKSLTPYMLPLYAPVLWLAYSANKKYKLSKRLIEEYTHKGVLSKTFEGLSKQIEDTPNQEITKELRTKLLYNLVDVNSENPGKLISDYNKSDHPLMDALDKSSKLADSVTKLSRVPGFSALATHLDNKAKAILESEDKKINAVLTPNETKKEQSKPEPANQN